ncbi:X-Pro dipeptidyl-peptidase (S15 family) [Actinomadura rubteroloni]|uniref:X-Pro dipeptidyl-peptidase (S15 family) n=1 Tax=Actinomadura rubteroloni TaxID=1926885 RepID=A0A2P4UDS4_9ACTN|nr:CocE/NonD family hydrolase [Actinomadura rubteroloni]POM23199.1 X-Pro dipeptidyl-peptidase (S15 family) [Actinomadura rubteroloni]
MARRPVLSVAVAGALVLAGAVPAHAAPAGGRSAEVASFDGTKIVTYFFPAQGLARDGKAPTILLGHGWGGRAATDVTSGDLKAFTTAGYNVVTWNARGFGSPGAAHVDRPEVEGRDVRKIIDWTAKQPEAQLDRKNDPRLGMAGGSYGGGIQLVAAGTDARVDAIVPTIAFTNVRRSLYPDDVFKAGWGLLLCAGGMLNGNRVADEVAQGCAEGLLTGKLSDATARWFEGAGAGDLVKNIRIPTLVVQGTVDTLFTLREGIGFYQRIKANRAPVKMIWFCGGHGECKTKPGPAGVLTARTLAWFDRYLKKKPVQTGPGFEYIDQDGVYRSAPAYPPASTGALRAEGKGSLTLSPFDSSGSQIAAAPASHALNIAIPAPRKAGRALGVPHLTLTYKGNALNDRTALYAQIVDQKTGVVVGNQATPLPVTLDGRKRTLSRDLEAVAWTVAPDSRLVLQITDGTALFTGQKAVGAVDVTDASLTVPTTGQG